MARKNAIEDSQGGTVKKSGNVERQINPPDCEAPGSANGTDELAAAASHAKRQNDAKKPLKPKDIDPSQYVTVRNGFQGRLVYKSKRTGERYVWESFGDEQDMELGELRNARNSNKKFFINNWFMFDEPWIIDYLGMAQYYKHAVSINDFDKIFDKPAAEVEAIVSSMSEGQKKSVAYRAKQLIGSGGIDSNKTIAALERSLGVELVER